MSEISEACQVVIICGKMILAVKDVMSWMAVSSVQVMNTIYMSKWKGDTSYKRLLKIKGQENGLIFLNVGAEPVDRKGSRSLKMVGKELEKHGILYAVMPDLCGGDGNTQICVSATDAAKVSAMLISHANGRYRKIPVGEISQMDYTNTARHADGSYTEEFAALQSPNESSESEIRRTGQKEKRSETDAAINNQTDAALAVCQDSEKIIDFTKKAEGRGPSLDVPKDIAGQMIREHDLSVVFGENSYHWLEGEPVLTEKIRGKKYHLVSLPDGEHGVIVPNCVYREQGYRFGEGNNTVKYGALVSEKRSYYTVDYKSGSVELTSGEELIRKAKRTPVEAYAKQMEKTLLDAKKRAQITEMIRNVVSKRQ